MAEYKRAGTWGEGYPLPATWGTVYAVWGGYIIRPSELVHLGAILLDATPTQDIWLDLTPYTPIRVDLTPEVSVQLEAGWGILPIEDVASGTDYDNMLFIAIMGHGNDALGFWVNAIGDETAIDEDYEDTLNAQVFD